MDNKEDKDLFDTDDIDNDNDNKISSSYNKYQTELDKIMSSSKNKSHTASSITNQSNGNKPKRKKKKQFHTRKAFSGIFLIIILICVSLLLALGLIKFFSDYFGLHGGNDEEVEININEGDTLSQIANNLEENDIIDCKLFFKLYVKSQNSENIIIPGKYYFSSASGYENIVSKITTIDRYKNVVTIMLKEGITLDEVAKILEKNNVCTAKEFIEKFNNSNYNFDFEQLINNDILKYYKMEGFLFPDTLDLYENNVDYAVERFRQIFSEKVYSKYISTINEKKLDFNDVMTLASMVQKEASDIDDMKLIASVFWNRLNNSENYPLLQSDPTKKYSENVVKANSNSSKEMVDAYNTYVGNGLPPGPICCPGEDAIEAVLNPAQSDYYYFCANVNTGEIYFAKTLEQHNQNLKLAGIN